MYDHISLHQDIYVAYTKLILLELYVVIYVYNPSSWDADAEEPQVRGHPELHSKFETA
jgi:hypothetical protein